MALLLVATKEPFGTDVNGLSALSAASKAGAHRAALFLVSHSFSPQPLVPSIASAIGPYATIDVAHEINARANETVGDYALGLGDRAKAFQAYQTSAGCYAGAITDCQHIISLEEGLLKEAKSGRKSRLIGTIAANIVGGGLAVATGLGFVAVPRRGQDNHIDEYTESLERNQTELAALTHDQTNLSAKLHDLEAALKTSPTSAAVPAPTTVSAAVAPVAP